MGYCVSADLFANGLPRGGTPNPGRLVASVDTSADTLELDVHGFATGDAVSFRAEGGGSLPSPLVAGTIYYAIAVSENRFAVALTAGGSAIDLTTAGARIVAIAPLPITTAIAWASRLIDDMLPAAVVPLTAPYPEIVVTTCAELAAWKMLALRGAVSTTVGEIMKLAQSRLERWAKHVPIRGDNAPEPASLAVPAATAYRDNRGWSRYGGI